MATKEPTFGGLTWEQIAAMGPQEKILFVASLPDIDKMALANERDRRAVQAEMDAQQGALDRQDKAELLQMSTILGAAGLTPLISAGAEKIFTNKAGEEAGKGIANVLSGSVKTPVQSVPGQASQAIQASVSPSLPSSGAAGAGKAVTGFSPSGVAANFAGLPGYAQVGIPAAIVAGGALTAKDAIDFAKSGNPNKGIATAINSIFPGIGSGVERIASALGLGFKSGKDPEQKERDAVRSYMQDRGLINDSYQTSSGYDVGRELDDGGRQIFDFFEKDANTGQATNKFLPGFDPVQTGNAIGTGNLIAAALLGGSPYNDAGKKTFNHAAGLISGNYLNGGNAQQDLATLGYEGQGGRDKLYSQVLNAGYDPQTRNALLAEIDKQFGVVNPNAGKGGTQEFGAAYIPK